MKKQYANPTVKVVFIEDADIVTESLGMGGNAEYDKPNDAKRRGGGIWGEDE